MINIDELITKASLAQKPLERDVYRLIKAKFLEYKTSKEGIKTPLNENIEINILRKMVSERKEDAKMYEIAQRYEQANQELAEASVIEALLPPSIDEETINKTINNYIVENGEITQKVMGKVIKFVKNCLPTADGSIISKCVKSYIK